MDNIQRILLAKEIVAKTKLYKFWYKKYQFAVKMNKIIDAVLDEFWNKKIADQNELNPIFKKIAPELGYKSWSSTKSKFIRQWAKFDYTFVDFRKYWLKEQRTSKRRMSKFEKEVNLLLERLK